MYKLKIAAASSLILSYVVVISYIFLEQYFYESDNYLLYGIWLLGILNVVLNIYYAIEIDIKKWIQILLVITATIWIFPFLLITYFGIPFLLIYLIIGIYIQLYSKPNSINENP